MLHESSSPTRSLNLSVLEVEPKGWRAQTRGRAVDSVIKGSIKQGVELLIEDMEEELVSSPITVLAKSTCEPKVGTIYRIRSLHGRALPWQGIVAQLEGRLYVVLMGLTALAERE